MLYDPQNVATWTAGPTGPANPGTAPAPRAGTGTSATSRPVTPGARPTAPALMAPASAPTVNNKTKALKKFL